MQNKGGEQKRSDFETGRRRVGTNFEKSKQSWRRFSACQHRGSPSRDSLRGSGRFERKIVRRRGASCLHVVDILLDAQGLLEVHVMHRVQRHRAKLERIVLRLRPVPQSMVAAVLLAGHSGNPEVLAMLHLLHLQVALRRTLDPLLREHGVLLVPDDHLLRVRADEAARQEVPRLLRLRRDLRLDLFLCHYAPKAICLTWSQQFKKYAISSISAHVFFLYVHK